MKKNNSLLSSFQQSFKTLAFKSLIFGVFLSLGIGLTIAALEVFSSDWKRGDKITPLALNDLAKEVESLRTETTSLRAEAVNLRSTLQSSNDFAAIEGPGGFNARFKANWTGSSVNTNSDMYEIKTTGILVKKEGYYYAEVVQRAGDDKNSFAALSIDGDRAILEKSTNGVWGHDHAGKTSNWSRSFYLGKLSANTLISGGWTDDNGGTWSNKGYAGIIQVRRVK